jgi:hypothetical protein
MLFYCIIFLQRVMRLAEESIPSSAENIAMAIGALCVVRDCSINLIPDFTI